MEKPKKTIHGLLIMVAVLLAAILFILFSPLFALRELRVEGNQRISEAEILHITGLYTNPNFFTFNTRQARSRLLENVYIDYVTFLRIPPNRITVTTGERFLSGYIQLMEHQYLYIDEQGRVLELRAYRAYPLPIIAGLHFPHFHLGEILQVENPEVFRIIATYTRLLHYHQIAQEVRMYVSDPTNIRMRLDNMEVYLGDTQDANEKILTLSTILQTWTAAGEAKGFLDLRNPGRHAVFRALT